MKPTLTTGPCVVGLVLALFGLPSQGAELWSESADEQACRVQVSHPGGSLTLRVEAEGPLRVEGDERALEVEATRSADGLLLEVGRHSSGLPAPEPGEPSPLATVVAPSHCSVALETTSGDVEVRLHRSLADLEVVTVTGSIVAHVGPNVATAVELATSGEITTDFTIDVDFRYHVEPAKTARLSTGAPAQDSIWSSRLTSRRGSIRVQRGIDPH